MALKYRDTDFLYSSARVRALEASVPGKDKLEALADLPSSADILRALSEYGFKVSSGAAAEDILLEYLASAYRDIAGMCPNASVVNPLRYPYDCNNIKAIIKCRARGVSPEGMLFPTGSVSEDSVKAAIESEDYSALPKNMAEAIPAALEAFAESGNGGKVDLVLDRACFADMSEAAKDSGVAYIEQLVCEQIDLLNIISCLRVMSMKLYLAAEPFMREVYIPGGSLSEDFFISGLAHGAEVLLHELEYTKYEKFASRLTDESPLYEAERAADDFRLQTAKAAKYVSFGAEVLVGYLTALEYAVKNLRIILAGKDAGLEAKVIKERLRSSYV